MTIVWYFSAAHGSVFGGGRGGYLRDSPPCTVKRRGQRRLGHHLQPPPIDAERMLIRFHLLTGRLPTACELMATVTVADGGDNNRPVLLKLAVVVVQGQTVQPFPCFFRLNYSVWSPVSLTAESSCAFLLYHYNGEWTSNSRTKMPNLRAQRGSTRSPIPCLHPNGMTFMQRMVHNDYCCQEDEHAKLNY